MSPSDQFPNDKSGDDDADTKRIQPSANRESNSQSDDLLPEVYHELRRLAQAWIHRLPAGQTLSATALVHEAYLRLAAADGEDRKSWDGRAHFFAAAAQSMRHILVDQARRKDRIKHGGKLVRLSLHGNVSQDTPSPATITAEREEILAVDAAIDRLKNEHPRQGQVVMLHYFAGLTHEQIAELLQVTARTVERDWRFAKAWLREAFANANESDAAER